MQGTDGLRGGVSAEASFGLQRRRPFDPALRDLRMNCTAAQFTSRRTPRYPGPAKLGTETCGRADVTCLLRDGIARWFRTLHS